MGIGFSGTATQTGGFDDITNLVGTAMTDTLEGLDAVATFTVNTANGGTYESTNELSFSNIENLTGGTNADTFVFNNGGSVAGMVDGADGMNTLDYSALSSPVDVVLTGLGGTMGIGFSGTATQTGGFDDITNLVGTAMTDTLEGLNADATFTVNTANGGTYESTNMLGFSNIERLTGGANADTFVFNNGGSVAGMVDGAGGMNTLDYNALSSPVDVVLTGLGGTTGIGFSGTATQTGGFDDITNLVGTAMTDTLEGLNADATFTVNTANGGTYESTNELSFSNIENLTGGATADTFVFNNGGSVAGMVDGAGGVNTLDYNALSSPVAVMLTGLGGTMGIGFSGTATQTGGFDDITNLVGTAMTDTLEGLNADATFTVNTANGGTYESTNMLGFSNIENLTGGANADTFVFNNGGSVAGMVDGAGGVNTLDYNALSSPVAVMLTGLGGTMGIGFAGTATQTGGFDDITNLVGTAMTDTLEGLDADATFTVNTANGGTYESTNELSFSNIENLTGGATADTFVFNNGGSVAGMVDGAGGVNTLDYNALSSPVAVMLTGLGGTTGIGFSGTATQTGGFDDITNLVGTAMTDTLEGLNADATFTVNTANGGTYESTNELSFSNIENLTGGATADTFVFNNGGSVAGMVDGAGGVNTLDYNALSSPVAVMLTGLGGTTGIGFSGTATQTGGFDDITNLVGTAMTDTLEGLNADATFTVNTANGGTYESTNELSFSNIENLTGGATADTFVFNNGGSVAGMVDGAGGVNTLDYNALSSPVAVMLTGLGGTTGIGFSGTATQTGGFDDITNLVGTAMTDTLQGLDADATFTVNAANGGTYESTNMLSFSGIENLTGGDMADTFTVDAALAGSITGGDGANIYDLNVGSVAGGITGGDGDEMFNINGAFTADLNGQGGEDTFTVGAALTGMIQGGADANIYNLNSGGSVSGMITGGAGADNFVFNGGSVTGMVDGAGGVNTLDYTTRPAPVVVTLTGLGSTVDVGFAGTASDIDTSFDDITNLVGTAMTDTLQGRDADATFTVNTANGGTYVSETRTLGFSSIENLTGGDMADTFTVGAALAGSIIGGDGANTYNLSMNGQVDGAITGGANADNFVFNGGSVTGMADGAGGINTLDYTTRTAPVVVTLTGLDSTVGFDGTATYTGGFDDITDVMGGTATTDTLQGQDADATFTVNAANGGTYESTNMLSFSGIENLIGGSMADTFTVGAVLTGMIQGGAGANTYNLNMNGQVDGAITGGANADTFVFNGGSVTGMVDGAGGMVNELDYSALSSPVQVMLTGTGSMVGFDGTIATGTGGFNNITDLTGSGADIDDTLTGQDEVAIFTLNGDDSGTYESELRTLNFDSIENLVGGTDDDTFILSNDGSVDDIDGADGTNTLSYDALTSLVDITLTGIGNMIGFAGSVAINMGTLIENFDDISNLVGSSVNGDRITGQDNQDATFTVNDVDVGTYASQGRTLGLRSIENLIGGAGAITTLQGPRIDAVTLTGSDTEGFSGTEPDISGVFERIDRLRGAAGRLTGQAETDLRWELNSDSAFGSSYQVLGSASLLNFDGFAEIVAGSGVGSNNIFVANGSFDDMVNLADSNNYWYHTEERTLTTGSVTGTGSLFIPDINRGDLVIGTGDLILPDLTSFTGHLVIGGIINPLAVPPSPYYVNPGPDPADPPTIPTILVNTETLTVAGIIPPSGTTATRPAINTGGPVTLLARNIDLNNDITAGGMIGLVAAAAAAGEGRITLRGGGEVTLTAPASTTRPSGAFIATDIDRNSQINLVLAFSDGEVDFAVGSGVDIRVSGLSNNADNTNDPDLQTFLDAISIPDRDPVRICTSANCFAPDEVPVIPAISPQPPQPPQPPPPPPPVVVPIFLDLQTLLTLVAVRIESQVTDLLGVETIASIDTGLFEEGLTLYGQIGTGIALALAQCEEQEGCAPNVTEEELDILISGLEEKVAQLEGLLDEELDDDERPRIEQLLLDYNMLLRDFRQYRESLREFFAVEDEVEEEEIQSLEEELAPVPVQPGVVKKLTGILENIKSRLEWLEGLKSDPEALERLGERSNIDLTPEVLDAIIESTRSEAQFIEDSIRRFIEGVPGAGRIGNDRSILLIDRRDMRDIQRQYAQQVPISVSKALQN